MKIKKGDQVYIRAGKDRGKRAKVLSTMPAADAVVVEGINLVKRHVKPRREGEHGQRVEVPAAMKVSKVMLVCPKCSKVARIGFKYEGKEKVRVCKKCKAVIA